MTRVFALAVGEAKERRLVTRVLASPTEWAGRSLGHLPGRGEGPGSPESHRTLDGWVFSWCTRLGHRDPVGFSGGPGELGVGVALGQGVAEVEDRGGRTEHRRACRGRR